MLISFERHKIEANKKEILPQKLPNFYRISLHIDDEEVVVSYGKAYGFKVYQLNAHDDEWREKIMERIDKIQKRGDIRK